MSTIFYFFPNALRSPQRLFFSALLLGARILCDLSAATPGTPEFIHNSPWTDDQVMNFTQPTWTTQAERERGLIPSDLAVRYAAFPSRVGTWQPSDSPFFWNFNTQSRAEALDAFWSIADVADKTPFVWTGNAATFEAGMTSQAYRDASYRFINYNRFLYHVANVRYVFENSDATVLRMVQEAALIRLLNLGAYSGHNVTQSWTGYNDLARQGSANSSLASWELKNVFALNDYFVDYGNTDPGHRIWLLNPYATSIARGVVRNAADTYTTEATWITFPSGWDYPVKHRDPLKYASFYPYAGYVPCTLLESVMLDDGILCLTVDFEAPNCGGTNDSTPAITVKRDGVTLPVISSFWSFQSLVYRVDIRNNFTKSGDAYYKQFSSDYYGADQKFEVTIDSIKFSYTPTAPRYEGDSYWIDPIARTPRSVSYSFTIFNPTKPKAEQIAPKSQVYGLSTRARIGQGDDVLIGGLSISGSEPVRVMLRGIGPSLSAQGIRTPASNPKIELHQIVSGTATSLGVNDAWKDHANYRTVQSYDFAPSDDRECAVIATLNPGNYTLMVSDLGSGGVGMVEAYAIDAQSSAQLNGVSSRGIVGSGEAAMISGFVLQKETTVIVRASGPSMAPLVSGTLSDPKLRVVRISDGVEVAANDDWDVPANARLKSDLGWLRPLDSREAATVLTLPAGAYTAVVESKGSPGVGIVEVYRAD